MMGISSLKIMKKPEGQDDQVLNSSFKIHNFPLFIHGRLWSLSYYMLIFPSSFSLVLLRIFHHCSTDIYWDIHLLHFLGLRERKWIFHTAMISVSTAAFFSWTGTLFPQEYPKLKILEFGQKPDHPQVFSRDFWRTSKSLNGQPV